MADFLEKNQPTDLADIRQVSQGFTLIELVVVIAVMGILYAVFATPKSADFSRRATLDAGAKQLKSDVALARERALHSGRKQRLLLTETGYALAQESLTGDSWEAMSTPLPLMRGVAVSTTLADAQLVFGADGVPYEDPQGESPSQMNIPLSAAKTIRIAYDGDFRVIGILPETGYVSVE